MERGPGREGHADLLTSAVAQAIGQLKTRPLTAVTQVVDVLAGDVLPWLAARELTPRQGSELDELEEREGAARKETYFVAPPSRPASETHVPRHRPRPVEVWSPARQLTELPVHPTPAEVSTGREQAIELAGLVERPRRLMAKDLWPLPHVELAADFGCEEGWRVAGVRWRGVRLVDVLGQAALVTGARHVRVSSGSYAVVLPLESAPTAVLCDELEGAPLGSEHGGPWRLVIPDGQCFTSVKWVDRLEVTAEQGEATAESTARSRLARATASRADT